MTRALEDGTIERKNNIMSKKQCTETGCEKAASGKNHERGLCASCYIHLNGSVKKGFITWEELEKAGRCLGYKPMRRGKAPGAAGKKQGGVTLANLSQKIDDFRANAHENGKKLRARIEGVESKIQTLLNELGV